MTKPPAKPKGHTTLADHVPWLFRNAGDHGSAHMLAAVILAHRLRAEAEQNERRKEAIEEGKVGEKTGIEDLGIPDLANQHSGQNERSGKAGDVDADQGLAQDGRS